MDNVNLMKLFLRDSTKKELMELLELLGNFQDDAYVCKLINHKLSFM